MLAKLFSFSGRMTRLEFLGWTIASIATTAAVAVAVTIASAAGARALPGVITSTTFALAGAGVIVVMALWSNLAICAKRVRDMGLSPILVIGAVIIIGIVDTLVLTGYTPARFHWPFDRHTMVGGIVNVAFIALLLFWPSQGAELDEPSVETFKVRAPRPVLRTSAPRGEFGLRTR